METDVHALSLGFEQAHTFQEMFSEIIGRKLDIAAYVDSKTIFYVFVKDRSNTGKRLVIDIWDLKQRYPRGKLKQISWFPRKENPSDDLTKLMKTTQYP